MTEAYVRGLCQRKVISHINKARSLLLLLFLHHISSKFYQSLTENSQEYLELLQVPISLILKINYKTQQQNVSIRAGYPLILVPIPYLSFINQYKNYFHTLL